MVVRSPLHAPQQAAGWDTRLRHAETALAALTPPRGRGKRQSTEAVTLVEAQAPLPGLHPENKRKRTDTPTVERLLHAFVGVSLPLIPSAAGEEILRRMTPLSGVQEALLHRLGLGTHLYRQLAMQNMGS